MASCATCNKTIIFGGRKAGELRYCNDKCLAQARAVADALSMITEEELNWAVHDARHGACPQCKGPGPNDVHVAHRVWSIVRYCQWISEPKISCLPCGRKRQWRGMIFSGFLGWWSIPGLFVTPLQLWRGARELRKQPDPNVASPELVAMMREVLVLNKLSQVAPGPPRGE